MFAAAGKRRSALAALACVAAVALAPVVGVGVLVLLGVMALRKDLLTRFPVAVRRLTGVAAIARRRRGRGPARPPGRRAGGAGGRPRSCWARARLLIGGASWLRLPWLRPPVAAVAALVACQFVPGPDLDAVLPAAAGLAVLAAVLTEEHHALFAAARAGGRGDGGRRGGRAARARDPAADGAGPGRGRRPGGGAGRHAAAGRRRLDRDPEPRPVRAAGRARRRRRRRAARARTTRHGPAGTPVAWSRATSARRSSAGTSTRGAGPGVFFALRSLRRATWSRSRDRTAGSRGSPCPGSSRSPRTGSRRRRSTARPPRPELRLITCGGRFDRTARSYTDNVVVEAVAA